jgi:hypothetical protein
LTGLLNNFPQFPLSPETGRRCPKGGRGVFVIKLYPDVWHKVPEMLTKNPRSRQKKFLLREFRLTK